MSFAKMITGSKVSWKGNLWEVCYVSAGIVHLTRDGETAQAKLKDVTYQEGNPQELIV